MAAQRALRVATPADARKKPKNLAEAIEFGTYREILVEQRRSIVSDLPNEKGPAKAALHRQLGLISKEIETLDAAATEGEGSVTADTADEAWDGSGY